MTFAQLVAGEMVGRYRIISHIARGGMADVYLAEDVDLKRQVALKVMLEVLAQDPLFVQRFRREARTVASLDHPNIVQVYSTGLTPTNQPYIAMQYIKGGSLRDKLEELASRGKLLTAEQALNIVRQVALALGAAHDADIVHRDLKPSNVLIRPDGTPVLVDLGIVAVGSGAAKLTQTGSLIGTPSYMSPDQVRGEEVDGRSDLYSLGVILYEMLTGRRPFEAEEPIAVLHKQVYEEPVPLRKRRPDLSEETAEVVATCMEKEPRRRYQTAAAMVAAIDRALAEEGTQGPNPQATHVLTQLRDSELISREKVLRLPTGERLPRRAIPTWVVATLVTIIAAFGLVFLLRPDQDDGGTSVETSADRSPPASASDRLEPSFTPLPPATDEPAGNEVTAAALATSTMTATALPTDAPVPTETDVSLTDTPPPTNTAKPTLTPTTALSQRIIGRDGVEMVLVSAGEFIMGSTANQVDAAASTCRLNPDGDSCARSEFTSEMPQHIVYLSGFYMDVTEITNDQYRACVNAGSCNLPATGSGRYARSAYFDNRQFGEYPVVNVTWFDARNYCSWTSERLPTEAEWEKGARGTDGRIFPWGNAFDVNRANTQDRGSEVILAVGQFPGGASPYGVLDMAGNVWEYVADWLDPDYYYVSPTRDPQGPDSSPTGERVLRSGSYANFQHYARVANRGGVPPGSSTQFRGIRCALDAQ